MRALKLSVCLFHEQKLVFFFVLFRFREAMFVLLTSILKNLHRRWVCVDFFRAPYLETWIFFFTTKLQAKSTWLLSLWWLLVLRKTRKVCFKKQAY